MAINASVNALINGGYTVGGYDANEVYLSNVTELNMVWPDATLYYDNGGLARTQLYYSTPAYDTVRYYDTLNRLTGLYGVPVTAPLTGGGMSATWFGGSDSYVQLQFSTMDTYGGTPRFFTTLTFGN